ncbi:MAG: glutaminase [Halieaceae bacterium]|nr:glutaminase [Halieaceae bacterium]
MSSDLASKLSRACDRVQGEVGVGVAADYIPALARVDPKRFGAAIITVDGDQACYGDAEVPFSIQSLSKVFTLTLALDAVGESLWERVGREPSGTPFNSIVQLELEQGIPRNPFINAGALVITDTLLSTWGKETSIETITAGMRSLAEDHAVTIDAEVARSEAETGERNRSLAHFLKSFGNLENNVDDMLTVYFHQCALAMTCKQLARAMLPLAAGGADPLNGKRIVSPERARRVNAIMLTCGHYDASGDFAFRVGLPAKSGVGGGIVAVAPERGAIAVWSPCLNSFGNSHAGTQALAEIVRETGWTVF